MGGWRTGGNGDSRLDLFSSRLKSLRHELRPRGPLAAPRTVREERIRGPDAPGKVSGSFWGFVPPPNPGLGPRYTRDSHPTISCRCPRGRNGFGVGYWGRVAVGDAASQPGPLPPPPPTPVGAKTARNLIASLNTIKQNYVRNRLLGTLGWWRGTRLPPIHPSPLSPFACAREGENFACVCVREELAF